MDKEEKSKLVNKKVFNGFLTLQNLRDVIVLLVLVVTTWKLISAKFTIDLSSFDFSDFLSLTMALFAISLSVAFFFKATDTSNKFYDNVYKFTKEVSEILGRIEAGFGERLKHIDEGYTGLRDKFESLPFDLPAAKQKEEQEKKEVEEKEAEYKEILTDLMERAQLAEEEKSELIDKLESVQLELDSSRRELRKLRRNIDRAELNFDNLHPIFRDDFQKIIREYFSPNYLGAPDDILIEEFRYLIEKKNVPPKIIEFMKMERMLSHDKRLTPLGVNFFKKALSDLYE